MSNSENSPVTLETVVEKFENNSRIEYIEETTANNGRIEMLEIMAENSDFPFTLMNFINKHDEISIYQIYGTTCNGTPKPCMVLSQ